QQLNERERRPRAAWGHGVPPIIGREERDRSERGRLKCNPPAVRGKPNDGREMKTDPRNRSGGPFVSGAQPIRGNSGLTLPSMTSAVTRRSSGWAVSSAASLYFTSAHGFGKLKLV